jgi:hypothetical protein
MKGKQVIVFFALCISLSARAQKPEQLLNTWSSKSPIEKTYLHLDRDNYIAGETAWFKAYLYSDYLPDTISTSLYVELVNDIGTVHIRAIVPVLLGSSNGHIELPDSLITGSYLIRAYSPTMLNQEGSFIYRHSIFIYGKKNSSAVSNKEKMIRLEFFPEGGNLVSDFNNTLAFKVTNENGLPISAKGNVLTEKNEVITTFSSLYDGMGMFELTPASNQKYHVLIDGDVTAKKYYLPEQADKGIALTVIPHPQGNFFEIKQRKNDPAFQVAYMIGQMQHHIVFRQEFKAVKEEIQGVINTQKLHSGILQITFFNKDDQPLAERLCFVDNKEYIQRGELIADTINFNEKGKNRFSIQLKDTVQGSFSISITDPEYNLLPVREENIFSNLLLTSDLKGYIHNPAYYFSADNDSVKTALDLVMMTNGWRRFKWTELAQKATQAAIYKDPSYITLSGKIALRDTKKPFAEKPLLLMLITADSTRSIQMISTDKQGNFRLDSMLFFGKSRLFFSDIRGKKNQYIDAHLSDDSLTKSFSFPSVPVQPFVFTNTSAIENGSKIDMDYDAIKNAKGVMLEGVTVKAKKKTPIEELEERYTSGMFSSEDNKIIDLTKTKETESYANIFDYLQSRLPGLSIVEPDYSSSPLGVIPEYKLYYRQAANSSVSAMGPIPMILYLNEVETESNVIQTISAAEVAMVKVFSTFAGASGGGAGGVLAIYTKKGSDLADVMQHTADIAKYNGYSVIKEFYAPNYTVNKSARTQTDNRITLDWQPDIRINNVNPKIPLTFYNNDRTKSFKIVVEGMTIDGKMLLIEKTISRKGF